MSAANGTSHNGNGTVPDSRALVLERIRADSRFVLDHHVVALRDELVDPRWRDRYAKLVVLDFPRNADQHGVRTFRPAPASLPARTAPARILVA